MPTDFILNKDKGYYDISFDTSNDIANAAWYQTAVLVSWFEERRADKSEVGPSHLRRGWHGNEIQDVEIGSKLWLFEQARVTGSMLAELGAVLRQSIQWLIDEGHCDDLLMKTPYLKNGNVVAELDIIRNGAAVEHLFFDLWENTTF